MNDPDGNVNSFDSDAGTTISESYNWLYLCQSGRLDAVDDVYLFGGRNYYPGLGSWMQEDPAGYVDGMNLYQFVSSNPLSRTDAAGRQGEPEDPDPDPDWLEYLQNAEEIAQQEWRDSMQNPSPYAKGVVVCGVVVVAGWGLGKLINWDDWLSDHIGNHLGGVVGPKPLPPPAPPNLGLNQYGQTGYGYSAFGGISIDGFTMPPPGVLINICPTTQP